MRLSAGTYCLICTRRPTSINENGRFRESVLRRPMDQIERLQRRKRESVPLPSINLDRRSRRDRPLNRCVTLPPLRGNEMANWSGVVKQLKEERDRVTKQLSALNAALAAFVGVYGGEPVSPANGKRTVSAAARRKMSLAQKARWGKVASNVQPKQPTATAKPKRVVTAASRRKMAPAQRARWARVRKAPGSSAR